MRSAKVGLVLGAGGARGLSHIGVIQVFEEAGIPIDMVVGCSIGAIIGSIYACGTPMKGVEQLLYHLDERMVYDIALPRRGLVKGDKLESIVRTLTRNASFEDIEKPMAFAACDIERGTLEMFSKGSISRAVRASFAIPGIFEPVEIDGRMYVDGGIINRLPVAAMREMGADMIIAVDVGYRGQYHPVKNIYDIIMAASDIAQWNCIQHRSQSHAEDILLTPDIAHIKTLSLSQAEECVELGRACARAALPLIREKLAAVGAKLCPGTEGEA